MCGRFRLDNHPAVQAMLEYLGVAGQPVQYTADAAPGSQISIIRDTAQGRQVSTATWWLFLDAKTCKPNYQYASFNSRWDKLDAPRSLSYGPFRKSRCIIPASAICEGLGDKKTYHMIELADRGIAFGGVYRAYWDAEREQEILGASIITLPSCERWAEIHPKSIPLMLDPEDQALVDRWLDPAVQDVDEFRPLLEPEIRCAQRITPIDKPSKWNPIGDSFLLAP